MTSIAQPRFRPRIQERKQRRSSVAEAADFCRSQSLRQ
jgi:hypothetical protein